MSWVVIWTEGQPFCVNRWQEAENKAQADMLASQLAGRNHNVRVVEIEGPLWRADY